jgi:hypothetical protein
VVEDAVETLLWRMLRWLRRRILTEIPGQRPPRLNDHFFSEIALLNTTTLLEIITTIWWIEVLQIDSILD